MSLMTDSPVHSSSSDDFAAFLDEHLDEGSSGSSSGEENGEEADVENTRIKRQKVEEVVVIEEQHESTTGASTSKDVCAHPGFYGGMCFSCGKRVAEESGVALTFIHKALRVANDEIDRVRDEVMKDLLRHKKLLLILDLDHTLLNTTLLGHITPDEEYLKSQAGSLQDISNGSLFMLEHMRMMTKLRPFVHTFLKEASQMFEMYIYTMGERPYALQMAKLLDPKSEYFTTDKVISRDDGTLKHQKGLDVVLGKESAVLILDDTENAWEKHKDNLILMERYHFFASSCRQFNFTCNSLSQERSDENESDGALANVLGVLRRIHTAFYDEIGDNPADRDVRELLKAERKTILRGCNIVFSRVFQNELPPERRILHPLWRMAEQLGATCLLDVGPSLTHVVARDAGTEKSRWAVKEKKFLVHPQWIEAVYYFWQRMPEENYPVVSQAKSR